LKKIRNKVYFWRITTSKCQPFGGPTNVAYLAVLKKEK